MLQIQVPPDQTRGVSQLCIARKERQSTIQTAGDVYTSTLRDSRVNHCKGSNWDSDVLKCPNLYLYRDDKTEKSIQYSKEIKTNIITITKTIINGTHLHDHLFCISST